VSQLAEEKISTRLTRLANQWHRAIIAKIAWPAPTAGGGLFFGSTLAQGCFNSSKPPSHFVSNSFTNWKRLTRRDICLAGETNS
jgi:hypothetical protein